MTVRNSSIDEPSSITLWLNSRLQLLIKMIFDFPSKVLIAKLLSIKIAEDTQFNSMEISGWRQAIVEGKKRIH